MPTLKTSAASDEAITGRDESGTGACPPAPSSKQIRKWIRDLGLPKLPSFVTAEQFLDLIAERRNREICLREMSGVPAGLCGLWVATDEKDTIVIKEGLTGPRRDLVIMHEAGHVLFGHRSNIQLLDDSQPARVLARTVADLNIADAEQIRTFLGRSHYDDPQEWQAEWLASYFLDRTRRTNRSTWVHRASTRYAARVLNGHD